MATHAEAAEEASLIFVCVHREHYGFLTTLAPHLKGKVASLPRLKVVFKKRGSSGVAVGPSGDVRVITSPPVSGAITVPTVNLQFRTQFMLIHSG